jgi:Kef-type K+ transport system membrane component KefB
MKNLKIELKWAFIFIVMMLTWMIMERVLSYHDEKNDQHALISNFVFIPAILAYLLALP